jgi:ribose transport system substrate-binding protein
VGKGHRWAGVAVAALAAGSLVLTTTAGAYMGLSPKATVAKYTPRPKAVGISTAVGKTIPKKKTVAFIQCSIPSCTHLGNYLVTAGKMLGWTVDRINGGLSPETVKNAYDEAISKNVDAVIGSGFPKSIFAPELATLKSMHIPVIELSVGTKPGTGITAVYEGTKTNQNYGILQADWAYAKLGKSANTLVIGLPTFPTITILETAFKKAYKQLCPSCTLGQVTVAATTIGTPKIPSTVVGYLQSHPTVNLIETSDSDTVIGLPSALASAGLHPKIIVLDESPTVASYIRKGEVTVSTASPWNTIMFLAMDTFARMFAGTSTAPDNNWVHPQWYVTSKNIPGGSGYYGTVTTKVNNKAFAKMWGKS